MKYIPRVKINPVVDEIKKYFQDKYPPDLVEAVIMHQFKEIRNFLEHPTHPTLLVRSLGRFIPSKSQTDRAIHMLITMMRSGKLRSDENNYQMLRELWRRRRLAQAFEGQFKYLKRYKQWHYKHKNPPSQS